MTQSGMIKKGKKGKKMINEFENYIQALKNLYTCMISLQDSLDEYERYDLLYDVLTDYLMVVERTARFLSRVKMVLKNMRIEEDIK